MYFKFDLIIGLVFLSKRNLTMPWQYDTCNNDYCNGFVKNKKTHLCTHHYDVFKQFLNSGMSEHVAQFRVEADDTQFNAWYCIVIY